MNWFTNTQTLQALNELVRLNAATATACRFAASQLSEPALWQTLARLGSECSRFSDDLADRAAQLGGMHACLGATVLSNGAPQLSARGEALGLLRRQLIRRVAAYDQALGEPHDPRTHQILLRQRRAAESARDALQSARSSRAAA